MAYFVGCRKRKGSPGGKKHHKGKRKCKYGFKKGTNRCRKTKKK